MANTTNFGWETPDDTDLVKDGASAMRTLGNAIDTSLVDLKGGTTGQVLSKASNTDMDFTWVAQDDSNAIQNAIVDAKGDLITATAADTPARLAVGSNDQVLTADSSTATGLKWATPVSGSLTLISTNTVSGAGYTISNISQSYTDLLIVMDGITTSTSSTIYMMPNGVTDYSFCIRNTGTTSIGTSVFRTSANHPTTANNGVVCIYFHLYSATNIAKPVRYWGGTNDSSSNATFGFGYWGNDTALSSFKIEAVNDPNYTLGGTIRLYGVK